MNGGATIKSHAAVLPEIDQSLRSAVANGMRTANVADLSDDLLRDMCDFGKSLPFGRTYVIVMPTGVESVMEKARRLCLNDVQLVPAFHKPATLDELPEAERALFSEDALQSLTTGEIAIHISHRKAVEQCRSDNVSSCLIFEEDFVSAGRELAGRWKSSYENMPSSWEFLFLGRCWDVQCDKGGLGGDMYRVPHDGMTPQCFHSYAVNRRGTESLLHGMSLCRTLGKCPVDKAVQALVGHGEVYTVTPALFTQSAIQRILEKSSSQLSGADMARMEEVDALLKARLTTVLPSGACPFSRSPESARPTGAVKSRTGVGGSGSGSAWIVYVVWNSSRTSSTLSHGAAWVPVTMVCR